MKIRRLPALAVLGILLGGPAAAGPAPGRTSGATASVSTFKASPAFFIPNSPHSATGKRLAGGEEVCAFVQTRRGRVLFTASGACVGIPVRDPGTGDTGRFMPDVNGPAEPCAAGPREGFGKAPATVHNGATGGPGSAGAVRTVVLGVGFGGPRQKSGAARKPRLAEPAEGKVNFLVGPQSDWRTNLPTYRKLVYEGVREGVDVEYLGYQDRLEYRLVVHPGGDPRSVVMETGGENLSLDEAGNLTAELAGAKLFLSRPAAWQEIAGKRRPVPVRYALFPAGRYGFTVGNWDPAVELIIDPMINWSTYLGSDGQEGSGDDQAFGIATDPAGNVYVTGSTNSAAFPTTSGAYDTTYNGNCDVFLTKFSPDGAGLLYSTFLGGSGNDRGLGIAVDASGQALVTGETASPDFPIAPGDSQKGSSETTRAFVTKLDPAGSALVFSRLLSSGESCRDIALDPAGNVYLSGTKYTYNPDPHVMRYEAFVTKLNSDASTVLYTSVLGPGHGGGIAVDAAGNAYVTGTGIQYIGGPWAWVDKLDASGAKVNGLLLGLMSSGIDIAVDPSGCAYVTGSTFSPEFVTTPGAYDRYYNQGTDAYVVKVNPGMDDRIYSTFLGGSGMDVGTGIAVGPDGRVCLTGYTDSPNFPVTSDAFDATYNGGTADVFVTFLNPAGSALTFSTYLGGSGEDKASGTVLGPGEDLYLAGTTYSPDFPVSPGAFDPVNTSGPDAFVMKIGLGCVSPAILAQPQSATVCTGQSARLSVTATGTGPLHYQWYRGASEPVGTDAPVYVTPALSADATYWVRVTNACGYADSPAATVTVAPCAFAAHAAASTLWWTRLNLVNTGLTDNPVEIVAYDGTGTALETRTLASLPAGSTYRADLAEIFSPGMLSADLRVTARSRSPLQGVLEFGTTDGKSYVAMPMETSGALELVFPYVVVLGDWYTGLTLVNPGGAMATVRLDAFAEDGALLSTEDVVLEPGAKYVRLVNLAFPDITDPSTIRFVKVTSDQPLVGFELFGNLASPGLAGLPASAVSAGSPGVAGTSAAGSTLVFTEVPDNDSYFTGVTFSNLGAGSVTAAAALKDAAGNTLAQADLELPPGAQVTREIWNLFDGTPRPTAASLQVTAANPLLGFELFLSRTDGDLFRFDGVPASRAGSLKLLFPLVKPPAEWLTSLRVVNRSAMVNTVSVRGYGPDGSDKGVYLAALAPGARLDQFLSILFPWPVSDIAWIAVEGTGELAGDLFMTSTDLTRLGSYAGIPVE